MTTHTIRCRNGEQKTFQTYSVNFGVRAFCTECLGWETDPKECTSALCPLFPFRARTQRTNRAAEVNISPETRARAAERMKQLTAAGREGRKV